MARTLFLGMDGATFTVLDHLTTDQPGEGITMPFLKKFMDNGVRAKLRSTANPLTPPAWVSLTSGRQPGSHGVYDFVKLEDRGSYVYYDLYSARDVKVETIWSLANRQNRSTVALNFTMTAPPREGCGTMVPGFVSWKHLRRNTTPPGLYDRISAIPDFDPKELAWDFEREKEAMTILSEDEMERWVRYHSVREKQWYSVAEHLLREDNPDLLAVVFDGVDKIQHQAWPFLDPALIPKNPTPWERRMREACVDYFKELDEYLEKLVEMAGPDCQVFMASDHGFTASDEVLRINTFLAEKGYLFWQEAEADPDAGEYTWSASLDWNRTTAYCGTPSSNAIRIRVADGNGRPGIDPSEYDAFRARLIADLETVTDDEGQRLITEIYTREEAYAGADFDNAPDISLVLRDCGFVSISNAKPMHVKRPMPCGTHHPDGVFLAGGPGLRAGADVERRNIVDVAATLLYSQGLPVPSDLDGQVPDTFFDPQHLVRNPVVIGPATLPVKQGAALAPTDDTSDSTELDENSEEYKAQIMEQLKMLGYME